MTERYESEDLDPSALGKPLHFEFSGRTAPNRFMKASMTERISSWDPSNLEARGIPSKELINVYKRWGEGGFGVVLTGNILIDLVNLEAAGNPIIPQDAPFEGERFEAFREMATQAKKHGSLAIGQVNHPGRQVQDRMNPDPVSASAVQLEGEVMGMTFGKPRAATAEDIKGFIEGFAHAAEYLEKSGYDGIQLHCAHGYLLAQFISQTTNRRTDQYGGSLANRARILVEIAEAIRKRTKPDFSLSIKLNSVEFQEDGIQPDEARDLCAILENNRFDFVELSGGTYQQLAFEHKRESTKKREAFFIEWADNITPVLKHTKVYVTGGFKTVGAMVSAMKTIDGVGLARPATQEPRLPRDILDGKVKGAIKLRLEEGDFGTSLVAAGSHIQQVGKDIEPIDLSSEENMNGFLKDMQQWGEKMANDKEMREQAYVDIKSVPTRPYGTVKS